MATIAKGDILLVPKFDRLKKSIEEALDSAGAQSKKAGAGLGRSVGGGFGKGLLNSGAMIGAFSAITSRAMGAISARVGDAISRFDTLNNYPRTMQNLGYSAEKARDSLDLMEKRLITLPTRLDDMAGTVQGLVAVTGDLDIATRAGLGLNDMMLASGSNQQVVNAAMEQFRQILAKGKPDMQDWKSIVSAAPGQMDQLAKSMLGPTANANDLYRALGGGGAEATLSMDDLLAAIIKLDTEGGAGFESFQKQAETASAGVATSVANTGNAVTRGISSVFDAIGKDRIVGVLNDVKTGINDAFKRIVPIVENAMPVIDRLYGGFKQIAPVVLTAVTAFIGFKSTGSLVFNTLSKLVGNTVNFVTGLTKIPEAFALVKGGAGTLTEALGAVGIAFNPVTAAITAVAAVAAIGIGVWSDWSHKQEMAKKATEGLNEAVKDSDGLKGYSARLEDVGKASSTSALNIDQLHESMVKHADVMRANNEKAQESIAALNTAQQIINDYTGQTDLSAQAQGKLKWALELLNEQFGLNISAQDVMNGQYLDADGKVQNLKDSINDLIEKKKEEARVNAVSQNLTEAYKAQNEAAQTLAEAQQKYNEQVDWFIKANPKISRAKAMEMASHSGAKDALDAARKAYDDTTLAAKSYEEQLGSVAAGSSSITDLTAVFSSFGDGAATALANVGVSSDELIQHLANAGVSTSQLSEIGAENFTNLATACNGNLSAMEFFIQHYNDTPILDHEGNVQVDSAELMDAQGNLYVWNGTQLVNKETGAEVDYAELMDAQGHVMVWNGTNLEYHEADGTVHSIMKDGIADRDNWNKTGLKSYQATGRIDIFRNITDTVSRIFGGGHASGGIRLNAAGGIFPRYHAAGAIATRAVPLDIVGEDGAEAIVPLTNRKYSQPFADIIAERVHEWGGQRVDDLLAEVASLKDELRAIRNDMPTGTSPYDFIRATQKAVRANA